MLVSMVLLTLVGIVYWPRVKAADALAQGQVEAMQSAVTTSIEEVLSKNGGGGTSQDQDDVSSCITDVTD